MMLQEKNSLVRIERENLTETRYSVPKVSGLSSPLFPNRRGSLSLKYIFTVAALAALYYGTARLGLLLAVPPGFATTVWPPSGIALAGLLLFGSRVWPGIWLGSFLANLAIASNAIGSTSIFNSLFVAASIGVGSTLQALLGAFLIRRWIGTGGLFTRARGVLKFFVIESLSCLMAATWGTTSLYLAGFTSLPDYPESWRTWWLGDLIGILTVTPLVLTWSSRLVLGGLSKRLIEALLSVTGVLALSFLVFLDPLGLGGSANPLVFVVLPCLVWVALRFGPAVTALSACLIAGVAIGATINGFGPFVRTDVHESLFLLQAFVGMAALTGLTLAAALSEHERAEHQIQKLNVQLEQRSLTDDLTGLNCRRGFFLLAELQYRLACRSNTPCVLHFMDVDGLKKVNDAFGHAAGDALLVAAADLLRKTVRESDIVGRLSGDEFAIFTWEEGQNPNALPARLQAKIAEFNRQFKRRYQLSVSVGTVLCEPEKTVSLEFWLAKADKAMYKAKLAKRSSERVLLKKR